MIAEMTANPSNEFKAWLATMGVPKDWVEDARNWLQRLFDQSGPVSAEDVKVAFVLDQMSAAEGAVELVLADLHRSSSERPVVVVDEYAEQIRISVDGSYQTPSVHAAPFDVAGMLEQVADYLQEWIVGDFGPVWPTCDRHGYGLHPEIKRGRAVWWCRPGDHSVAAIGALGTQDSWRRAAGVRSHDLRSRWSLRRERRARIRRYPQRLDGVDLSVHDR